MERQVNFDALYFELAQGLAAAFQSLGAGFAPDY